MSKTSTQTQAKTKKKKGDKVKDRIKGVPIDTAGHDNYLRYSVAMIEDRFVVGTLDGVKPVLRRGLWAIYQLGLTHKAKHDKSAKVIGKCFAAGTPVSTPNGLVAIENLRIGDTVLTSQGESVVTTLFKNEDSELYQLKMTDGKVLILTEDQCVKVKVGDEFYWKPANLLTPEDEIVIEI